ncbi:FusB/FusC family EF-G-binding protein [Paenibacillus aestuarii]|uniref:FusB/FusC family EF-G-binding protein n=1 Tax=Paenibacillus aestuarii TaxID=516965 RepID=A0ABW0KHL9_9BACL|nr:FusB/FusC family EF-G-binding protein [Paenibacillus aestuarii]
MSAPFIRNYHYNYIKKQTDQLLHAIRTNAELKILQSVRDSAEAKVTELFPDVSEAHKQMLTSFTALETADDFHKYLKALEPHLDAFPPITEKQIQKLFPKNKKLKTPDLSAIDHRYTTYLSWTDIATNKLFIVYHRHGQFVGVEGRFTPTNKKSYCFICNRYEELVLFSAISKKRPAKSSPDYYKAVGNYMCMHSHECNKNVTDPSALEKFLDSVLN